MGAVPWLPGPLFDEHARRTKIRGLVPWTLWSKHLSPCNRCLQGESRLVQSFGLTRIILDLEDDFAVDPVDDIYRARRSWTLLYEICKLWPWIICRFAQNTHCIKELILLSEVTDFKYLMAKSMAICLLLLAIWLSNCSTAVEGQLKKVAPGLCSRPMTNRTFICKPTKTAKINEISWWFLNILGQWFRLDCGIFMAKKIFFR